MPSLQQLLSPIFCCFGGRRREENATSDLHTLPSALYLPASQIPHAVNHTSSARTDTQALRELFRDSSSIRGYRTASAPSGSHLQRQSSFDAEFKFGTHEPPSKQPSKLEQLESHIKQKLSESGLSKTGSKAPKESDDDDSTKNDTDRNRMILPEISMSQRSTGLVDLLKSRSASEGGYDSDAKSIQTVMLKSREATLKLGPDKVQNLMSVVTDHEYLSNDGPGSSASATGDVRSPHLQSDLIAMSTKAPGAATTQTSPSKSDELLDAILAASHGQEGQDNVKTSEDFSIRRAVPFAALETGEEDPFTSKSTRADTVVRGLSDTKGTERLSNTHQNPSATNRASLTSNMTDPRVSLISNVDSNLLDYIAICDDCPSPSATSSQVRNSVLGSTCKTKSGSSAGILATTEPKMAREDTSKMDLSSIFESERNSVHLYSMRVSQRLASPSLVAASSRPTTSQTTTHVARQNSANNQPSISRRSTSKSNVGRITSEHNRRPSDPQTRRLFEGYGTLSRPTSPQRHDPVIQSFNVNNKPVPAAGIDDASSVYWSDGDVDDSGLKSTKAARRNPNSIAVGGRSESISLPVGSNVGSLSVAEDNNCFSSGSSQQGRRPVSNSPLHRSSQKSRSVSMPGKAMHVSHSRFNLPSGRLHQGTEADEALSEINLDPTEDKKVDLPRTIAVSQARKDARDERLTEISLDAVREARNEKLSEAGPFDPNFSFTTEARPEPTPPEPDTESSKHPLALCVGGSHGVAGHTNSAATSLTGKAKLPESATNVWQKSFKRFLEGAEHDSRGGFLTSPRFDREGRRRSTRSSISAIPAAQDGNSDIDVAAPESIAENGSSKNKDNHVMEICMKKPEPVPSFNPRRSIGCLTTPKEAFHTFGPSKTSRKKSLLDIGRRVSALAASHEANRKEVTGTPLKELRGLWSHFPSHTREERCGPAGAKDGVAVRDFALECRDENDPSCSTEHVAPVLTPKLRTPASYRRLPFIGKGRNTKRKAKSASPLYAVSATHPLKGRSRKARGGFVGRIHKLYRSSSMDFQAYTHNYGHRSSISIGAGLEYPDLEVVSGRGPWRSYVDGTADSVIQDRSELAGERQPELERPLDTASWTQVYRDCVGSLSAIKSDPELHRMTSDGDPGSINHRIVTLSGMSSADLRDSTVDFQTQLGKENEIAKESLIRKVESMQPVEA